MKILVTGANGQLGSELRELAPEHPEHEFIFTDLPELDLTNTQSLNGLITAETPGCIINCAAYTAVDKAESDPESAFRVNARSVNFIAEAAARKGALLIHISTDYVFNGEGDRPYREDDSPAPRSVYGASKLEGEAAIIHSGARAVIIRTSWLYSTYGHNFVKTMMRLGKERGEVGVVSDQLGSPTWARDLAGAILEIIPQTATVSGVEFFHFCNSGTASWFDFAKEVMQIAGISCVVRPILTRDFPTAARRPAYSVLDTSKIRKRFGIDISDWRESLARCIKMIRI